MARNVDIFAETPKAQYIYQQYQRLEWLKKYAAFMDEYIQKNYFKKLSAMWDTMNVATSLEKYLTFYTKYYFGLYRPLAGASMTDRYDLALLYDNKRIYDDAQEADGLVDGEQYLKYIKFIYDYSYDTWHFDFILSFIADYCEMTGEDGNPSVKDIYLDFSDKQTTKIKIPNTDKAQEFIKLVTNNYDDMCLPFPAILDIQIIQDGVDDKWRGIIYSPYGCSWYVIDTTETYSGKSVAEKRTYDCLQDDKSVDLTNREPQNFSDTDYWTLAAYSEGEYIMVLQDSEILTDPSDSTSAPIYTKGIYRCVVEDNDIDIKKVSTYSELPTSREADAVIPLPLSFSKYIEISATERASVALEKWERVEDLPPIATEDSQ